MKPRRIALWVGMALLLAAGLAAVAGWDELRAVVARVGTGPGPVSQEARELKLRVVDDTGRALAKITIEGWEKEIDWARMSDREVPFTGRTDDRGEFTFKTKTHLHIRIRVPGYFTVDKYWRIEEIPAGWTVVRLDRENSKVVLFVNELSFEWHEDRDIQFGLRLIDGRRMAFEGRMRKGVTDRKELADVWFDIRKLGAQIKDPRAEGMFRWSVQVTGCNGWEVAPGPTEMLAPMRAAPHSGYQSSLEYSGSGLPEGIYLRLKGGKRYGKIFNLWFRDASGYDAQNRLYLLQNMKPHTAVQAEAVGHGSLNPFTPQEEEKYLAARLAAQRPENTRMRRAAMMGETAEVAALLQQGAEIDSINREEKTALILAAENGHADTVRYLIERGADVNRQERTPEGEEYGGTALMKAAWNGHQEVVRILVENGALLEEEDCIGRTALLWAADRAQEAIVRYLLQKGSNVNHTDDAGETALMRAAVLCDTKSATALVGAHANLNTISTLMNLRLTALILASQYGCTDIVRMLVENGADLKIRSKRGTALKVAREKKREDIVKILLAAGATE